MATKAVLYRHGRGYIATLVSGLGIETWYNTLVKTVPDPTGSEGTVNADNGPQRLSGGLTDLGNASIQVPQDDDTAEGARISSSLGSLVLQKSGEKTRGYIGYITKDGGASLNPSGASEQVRTISLATAQRAIIVTESGLSVVKDAAISGSIAATALKNDGTADTIAYALDTGETLPTGASLNASTGAITGTVTANAGTYTVIVKLTTSIGVIKFPIVITVTASS